MLRQWPFVEERSDLKEEPRPLPLPAAAFSGSPDHPVPGWPLLQAGGWWGETEPPGSHLDWESEEGSHLLNQTESAFTLCKLLIVGSSKPVPLQARGTLASSLPKPQKLLGIWLGYNVMLYPFIQTLGILIPGKEMENPNMEYQAWHSRSQGRRDKNRRSTGWQCGSKRKPLSQVWWHTCSL